MGKLRVWNGRNGLVWEATEWHGVGRSGFFFAELRMNGMVWNRVRRNRMEWKKDGIIDIRACERVRMGGGRKE